MPYVIRDFRTSPLPSCVMLAGPGARGQLPKTVPGLRANCKADVYQFTWNNPRPEVAIATIDLEYGDQGSRYGTPALLAITAATKAE